jgi:GT2 family glycosyltransferase
VKHHAPAGTEIIVVDDASPGETVSTAAAAFAEVRLIRLPTCHGFCRAINAGIRVAKGAVIELLNDDTEVTAGWARAALGRFGDPSVAAVAPLVLCLPAGKHCRIDSAGDRYYVGGVAGKRGHRELLESRYLQPCRVFGASASSAFYRRDVLLRVGGLPESFGAYFEDVDLSFRLHWAGYQVRFEPTSRVFHRVSASYGRPRRHLLEQQSRNEERVFWRNLPGHILTRAVPQHLAVIAAKAWRRWQEGGLAPFLCGRLRIIGEIKTILEHRRQVHQLGSAERFSDWHVEPHFWG